MLNGRGGFSCCKTRRSEGASAPRLREARRGIMVRMRVAAMASFALLLMAAANPKLSPEARACAAEARHPTPDDPTGKPLSQVDGEKAVSICKRALEAAPNDIHVKANLGRAMLAAYRRDEATRLLREAAEAGSGQAQFDYSSSFMRGVDGAGAELDRALADMAMWLERSAQAGFVPAMMRLAGRYERRDEEKEGGRLALKWYRKALSLGEKSAYAQIGDLYAQGAPGLPRDWSKAVEWFRRGMAAGDGSSAYRLGNAGQSHLNGAEGAPKDRALGMKLLREAAESGETSAQVNLGGLYWSGEAVAKDAAEAIRWWKMAADRGLTTAMDNLGVAYWFGEGSLRNPAEAVRWWEAAGEAGSTIGLENAGFAYWLGVGVPLDWDKAKALWEKAGERWSSTALRRLAAMADEQGKPEEAAAFVTQAAERGDVPAMIDLAARYDVGDGVPRSPKEALAWRTKAGDQGGGNQKSELGQVYLEGRRAPFDLEAARVWLQRAVEAGEKTAAAPFIRATLAGTPSPQARDLALKLLREAAERKEGWALAALAHPGPPLRKHVEAAESELWRGKIAAETTPEILLAVAEALQDGKIADQDFGLAIRYAASASDPVAAKGHELGMLVQLKLNRAAITRFAAFLETAEFKAASEEKRKAFVQRFDEQDVWTGLDEALETTLAGLSERGMAGPAAALGEIAHYRRAAGADFASAARWYETALDRGRESVAPALATLYYEGHGGSKPDALMVRLTQLSRNAEVAKRSHLWLGRMYLEGVGIERDPAQAFRWLRSAASAPGGEGKYELAKMYLQGIGTPRDVAAGIAMLEKAVENGSNKARVLMGHAHLAGAGVPRDPAMALRWFKSAARYGGSDGARETARAAALGWGMKPSAAEAGRWLLEAKRRGDGLAAGWIETCGTEPKLACLRASAGFVPAPVLQPSEPVVPVEGFAASEKRFLDKFDAVVLDGGSQMEMQASFSKLRQLYDLHERPELMFELYVRRLLYLESLLDRMFGSRDNYFALLSSSCEWSQAAQAAQRFGRSDAALFFAKVAVNRLQDARKRISELGDDVRECFLEVHSDRYRYLADLFMGLGRFVEADQVLAMLKDFEHYTYTRDSANRGQSLEHMSMSAAEKGNLSKVETAMRSLSAAGAARERLAALKDRTLTPAEQAELAAATTALDASRTAFRAEMAALRTQLAALDRAAPAAGDVATRLQKAKGVNENLMNLVKQEFGKDGVLLHAVVAPDRIHWLLTTRSYQKAIKVPVPIDQVRLAIGGFREMLQSPKSDAAAKARQLYELIFAPVDAELKQLGVERVMLSLDGVLRYVPFAALHDGKDWLVRRYAFSHFRDSLELTVGEAQSSGWRVAAFGASKGGQGMSALPAVPRELSAIVRAAGGAGVLDGRILLDQDFNRASFVSALRDNFPVVHIASHFALSAEGVDKSFLLLGDGQPLSLKDFGADGSISFGGADLVALSACQTALAPGSTGAEIDSMGEIALNNGAAAVLASLWSVSDSSTASLMEAFYRASIKGAGDKGSALKQAQLQLLNGAAAAGSEEARSGLAVDRPAGPRVAAQSYSHPFYWAPFVLLGNRK